MRRRAFTKTERGIIKKAKSLHKLDKRSDPSWFEAKRGALGNEIVTAAAKSLPRWGNIRFRYTKQGV